MSYFNVFRPTTVCGGFLNSDSSDGTQTANAVFQRNVTCNNILSYLNIPFTNISTTSTIASNPYTSYYYLTGTSAPITINLPATAATGCLLHFISNSSYTVTISIITGNSATIINETPLATFNSTSTSITISNYGRKSLIFNGTNWILFYDTEVYSAINSLIATINSTISSLSSSVVTLTGSQTITGNKSFTGTVTLPANSITNSNMVNTCINAGYCDATSSIQTQLNAKALDSAVVHTTGTQYMAGTYINSGTLYPLGGINGNFYVPSGGAGYYELGTFTGGSDTSCLLQIGSDYGTNGHMTYIRFSIKGTAVEGCFWQIGGSAINITNVVASLASGTVTIYSYVTGGALSIIPYLNGGTWVTNYAFVSTTAPSGTALSTEFIVWQNASLQGTTSVQNLTASGTLTLPANSITNTNINNSCINSGYCDATSSIQGQFNTINTEIAALPVSTSVVHLAGAETITGVKTFSANPVFPSGSIPNSALSNSAISSGYCDATSSIQTQLNAKATDSSVVHLTAAETITGVKTFSANPVFPSGSIPNAALSNTTISAGYCDATSSIQTQLNAKALDSAVVHTTGTQYMAGTYINSGTLYPLGGINGNFYVPSGGAGYYELGTFTGGSDSSCLLQIGSDYGTNGHMTYIRFSIKGTAVQGCFWQIGGSAINITNVVASLASGTVTIYSYVTGGALSIIPYLNGGTWVTNYAFVSTTAPSGTALSTEYIVWQNASLQGTTSVQNLTASGTLSLPANSITNTNINNSCINSGYCDATSSIQTQLNAKGTDSSVVHLAGAETITGVKTFSANPVFPSGSIPNSALSNSAISSGYCDATSSIQTQLNAKATDSLVVHLAGAETITGVKTFSANPVFPSGSIPNAALSNTTISSGYCDATSSIQGQFNTKANDSAVVHNSGNEGINGIKTFNSVPNFPSASIPNSVLQNSAIRSGYCDATSSIQTQLNAAAIDSTVIHLAGTETITGTKTFSAAPVFPSNSIPWSALQNNSGLFPRSGFALTSSWFATPATSAGFNWLSIFRNSTGLYLVLLGLIGTYTPAPLGLVVGSCNMDSSLNNGSYSANFAYQPSVTVSGQNYYAVEVRIQGGGSSPTAQDGMFGFIVF